MRVLVTGARGLLGSATAEAIRAEGHEVRVFQRTPSGLDIDEVLGDIRDPVAVSRAVHGCEAVVHLAARVGVGGSPRDFASVNVDGTATTLAAAREAGVRVFIQVSSPSVAHLGRALVGAPAGPADPERARSPYARTKARAEQIALAADEPGFAVVALRPHLVFGPGDVQLIEPIWRRARAGRLIAVGSGLALIDTTVVQNAASAMVAALRRADVAHGSALVVSNGEPRTVVELLDAITAAADLPAVTRSIPLPIARLAGWGVEGAWRLARRRGEPPLTAFVAEQLGTAHWFDQRRTRDLLDWRPRVTLDEGLAALAASGRMHR